MDEVEVGIISRYAVLDGNPTENPQLPAESRPSYAPVQKPTKPAAGDRGVHTTVNEQYAAAHGVNQVVLPKPGDKSAKWIVHEQQRWFRRGPNWALESQRPHQRHETTPQVELVLLSRHRRDGMLDGQGDHCRRLPYTHLEIRAHRAYVRFLPCLKGSQEVRIVPIIRVGYDTAMEHAPAPHLIGERLRNFRVQGARILPHDPERSLPSLGKRPYRQTPAPLRPTWPLRSALGPAAG